MADIPDQAVTAARKACPFANADMLRRALQAAQPHIAAAERQRIRQLAIENDLGGCYLMIAQAIGDTDGTATMLNHFKTSTP